jgi:hypothetical protein
MDNCANERRDQAICSIRAGSGNWDLADAMCVNFTQSKE